MFRPRASLAVPPDDLYIASEPWPRIARLPKHDVEAWTVTGGRPNPASISNAEFDVFEALFGDAVDELLAGYTRRSQFCSELAEGEELETYSLSQDFARLRAGSPRASKSSLLMSFCGK
jgi:hypothetical protein